MVKLRVPSVQHLARNWDVSPKKIEDAFVKMALNPPFFNYNALNDVARDSLLFGVSEEQIIKGIKSSEKRKRVRDVLLEVVPMIGQHFEGVVPDFVHDVAPSYYPIGRGFSIPFKSAFIYGVGGQVYLPWFVFWKNNPMNNEQFSLFVTLAKEIISQDPDLEGVKFEILDFSVKQKGGCRELRVIDSSSIPTFDRKTTAEMLAVFVEGFEGAENRLRKVKSEHAGKQKGVIVDVDQLNFW